MTERAKAVNELPHSAYFAHTVRRAYSVAQRRGSAIVGLEHFLYALLDDPDALALMEGCDADIASIRVELGTAIEKTTPRQLLGKDETPQAGKGLRHVLQVSQKGARESGRSEVDGAIALAALVGQSDTAVARLLNRHGLSFGKALGWIDAQTARDASAAAPLPEPEEQPRAAPSPAAQPSQRPAPAKRDMPPTKSRERNGAEPTLEDMLATIRDVIDEEAEAPPPAPEQRRAPARKPGAQAPTPSGARQPAETRPPAPNKGGKGGRRKTNGAAGAQHKRRRAAEADAEPKVPALLGKLVERIPRTMREGEREHIEVRIAREASEELLSGVQGRGTTHVHGVTVTRAMSLSLRAPDGGFMIEPLTPETQWVFDRPSFLESEPFGRWEWVVLPMKRGSRKLQLIAAARSVDENGMIGDVALPEQVIDVRVRINWARSLRKVALWAGLAIAGGVLAEIATRFFPGLMG
ncbi:Clp protease N-terminal domain-containing protein [Dichotomicrobium thermohalophilum]|uniref:ClpA/ClpB-like protein n=1 Tax=Dichotomicrobium thermohalophilum TaxID=933063 RepID=A0A397QBE1_9HYPH|nr:Clp protease N-terminal domain-containing protein [Dichotomicrobium thermohalophilum]RIA55424.1 ClpA/ClpB-like protein [Dichotomicrobium thermohalophilum]